MLHRLVGVLGAAEDIGQEQRSRQPGPPSVGPPAVDAGADGILLSAENADAVVVGGEEQHIFRHSVLSAEGGDLL